MRARPQIWLLPLASLRRTKARSPKIGARHPNRGMATRSRLPPPVPPLRLSRLSAAACEILATRAGDRAAGHGAATTGHLEYWRGLRRFAGAKNRAPPRDVRVA